MSCLPNTSGPARWSDDKTWYRDHYGSGLAQLTWERFDWVNWPRFQTEGQLSITTSESGKPTELKPYFFPRQWSFGGSYWCALVSHLGQCFTTSEPLQHQLCGCTEYTYAHSSFKDYNGSFYSVDEMIAAYCGENGSRHVSGAPNYIECKMVCDCKKSDYPGLARVCPNGGCDCTYDEDSWVWVDPGDSSCLRGLTFKMLICSDNSAETCLSTTVNSGEQWTPLLVSNGPVNAPGTGAIWVRSGPSPDPSDPFGRGLTAGFGWVSSTNDPPIPVDAESRLRLRVSLSGGVKLRISELNEASKTICLSNQGDFCDNADLMLTPDTEGLVALRLGDLFTLKSGGQIDAIDVYFGSNSSVRLHFLDINPAQPLP